MVFLGHVDDLCLDLAGVVGYDALDLGESFIEGRIVDVGHEDRSALLEEEDCGFETDAAIDSMPLALARSLTLGYGQGQINKRTQLRR